VCACLAASPTNAKDTPDANDSQDPKIGSIVLGLSAGELLVNKTHKELIQPYETRRKRVVEFLAEVEPDVKVEVHELHDAFGPSVSMEDLTTLVVSQETSKGGSMVNDERARRGLSRLKNVVVDLVQDDGTKAIKVSSTTIRSYLANQITL